MNVLENALGFPLLPQGKLFRLREMQVNWWDFWWQRNMQRRAEGWVFEWFGTSHPSASLVEVAKTQLDTRDNTYYWWWLAMVLEGPPDNPTLIDPMRPYNEMYFGWLYSNVFLEGHGWEPAMTEADKAFHRYVIWFLYQTAIAECIYKMIHYTPRPGAGNYGVE